MQVSQIIALVFGICILTYVLFAYEDEERKAASWFDVAFAALKRTDSLASERLRRALGAIVRGYQLALHKAYGPRLFSTRSVFSSASFCVAVGAIVAGYLDTLHGGAFEPRSLYYFLFVSASLAAPFLHRGLQLFAYPVLLIALHIWSESANIDSFGELLLMFSVIAVFDSAGVAALRRCFRSAEAALTLRSLICWLLFATLCPVVVVVLLAEIAHILERGFTVAGMDEHLRGFAMAGVAMILPVLTSFIFLIALVVALILRLASALLPRALYSLIKFKVLEKRREMGAMGVALIAIGSPVVGSAVQKLLPKLFGG